MFKQTFNNVLNICGAGRNVGKTFLGENIIAHFSTNNDIISIKISKFKHLNHAEELLKECYKTDRYTIWQELAFSDKDSGRYLKAGAKISYYIECDDAHLLEAFLKIYDSSPRSCLIICESASLTKYIKPKVSIFVASKIYETAQNKLRCLNQSNLVLEEESIEISMPQLLLLAYNNKWKLKYSKANYSYVRT
jgi:hypothetical protein